MTSRSSSRRSRRSCRRLRAVTEGSTAVAEGFAAVAVKKRLHAKDKKTQKKVQRDQEHFRVLLSRALLLPLLVNDLIHMRHGYQSGCVVLQQTKAVFFKLHLHAAQMWWHCMWLGASQWERHALLHHICGSVGKASGIIAGASHNGEAQAKAWCFRCRFCGLLSSTGPLCFTHLENCQLDLLSTEGVV